MKAFIKTYIWTSEHRNKGIGTMQCDSKFTLGIFLFYVSSWLNTLVKDLSGMLYNYMEAESYTVKFCVDSKSELKIYLSWFTLVEACWQTKAIFYEVVSLTSLVSWDTFGIEIIV